MRKLITCLFVMNAFFGSAFAFAGSHQIEKLMEIINTEVESLEKNPSAAKAKKVCPLLRANLAYVEDCIDARLKHLNKRLARYQTILQETQAEEEQDQYEIDLWNERISKIQDKINSINKIKETVEIWKAKLLNFES